MSKKRKPDLEGASSPDFTDPRIAEEARRLLAEEEAAMSETELRARRDAERKRQRKQPRAQRKKNAPGAAGDDAGQEQPEMRTADPRIAEEVRRFTEGQQQRIAEDAERNPVLPSLRTNPFGAAQVLLDRYFTKDGVRLLVYYREDWYQYKGQRWALVANKDVESALFKRLLDCRQVDAEGEIHDFVTSKPNLDTIYFQIEKNEMIPSDLTMPCVREPDGSWHEVDGQGSMVCRGEIVDMLSGKSKPTLYTFVPNGADWRYDPDAPEPERWLAFLDSIKLDAESIGLLQEWFGYVLSGDTWAQKGMIIVGPPRAGKGIIGHVLSELVGQLMVASPALHTLGREFGLEPLLNKRLCLVNDARLSNRIDAAAVIESLLRIVAADSVSVARKFRNALNPVLGARVMILSNEMPQLGDNSNAINTRFLILELTETFLDREDTGLKDALMEELPGIALWAVKGYKRLQARGAFLEPDSSKQARQDWYEENNPIAQFVADRCEVKPGLRVGVAELYAAYCAWANERGMTPMADNAMSRRLAGTLGARVRRHKERGTRFLVGITLLPAAF